MDTKEAIGCLRQLVKAMVSARVRDKAGWRDWRRVNEALIAECLAYEQQPGMPPATSLMSAHFHPELPLIGLNYTGAAHNILHAHPNGWTLPLRYCRGIVFDRRGVLRALPFLKFFNYGEHPETNGASTDEFEATEKHDGHLGIVFRYRGQFILTTRGTFTHGTSIIGNRLLTERAIRNNWEREYPANLTLLVEVIHPDTKVHLEYGGREDLIVIGARDTRTLQDYGYNQLVGFAQRFGLPHTQLFYFQTIEELRQCVQTTEVLDREGFVARFPDGRRIKFKFYGYLGVMFSAKLTFGYVLRRIMAGDLDDRLAMMPREDSTRASQWAVQAMTVRDWSGTPKERWTRLYGLLPEGENTPNNKTTCREFIRWIDQGGSD